MASTTASSRAPTVARDPRSPAELEVLRTLWAHPGAPLVRSQIHKNMVQERRPTLGRVGQILSGFHKAGLVVRSTGPSQGSKSASFYELSEKGRQCARFLGLVQKETLHFPVSDQQLANCLNLDNLCRARDPGRILAVYGYQGGLGRTLITAFVAYGLAKQQEPDKPLLAIDLNLTAPNLDRFLQAEDPRPVRGLAGLLVDFHLRPRPKRALWLRCALRDPAYVIRTFSDEQLYFLPSGFSDREDLSASERAEALTLLNSALEIHLSGPSGPGEDFLAELRRALLEVYDRTVVDCESGRSLGGWIATQMLADELLLCAQYEEPPSPTRSTPLPAASLATRDGLRAILANFLACREKRSQSGGRFVVLLRAEESLEPASIVDWAATNLVHGPTPVLDPAEAFGYCPVVPIMSDRRLQILKPLRQDAEKDTHHSFWTPRLAHFEHLIHWLRNDRARTMPSPPAEMQALSRFLDPAFSKEGREILWNQIASWKLPELMQWVDRYFQQNPLDHSASGAIDNPPDPSDLLKLRKRLQERFEEFLQLLGDPDPHLSQTVRDRSPAHAEGPPLTS